MAILIFSYILSCMSHNSFAAKRCRYQGFFFLLRLSFFTANKDGQGRRGANIQVSVFYALIGMVFRVFVFVSIQRSERRGEGVI